MALSPSYLDSCPAGVVSLWQQCEDDILQDMARKIRKYNFYIPSSQWQENRLKAGRQTRKDIVKTLSKYTGMSQAAVNKLIQESAQLSVSEDVNAITRGEAYKVGELDRAALNQILRSSALQTNAAIYNICATTANTATQQFERALDRAWMQVSSGAFSLDTAVERACLDLANSGISAIQYAKKADTIEVAVRRAVRTGVNQTALKLTGEICEQLECDLVEVSAHAGARPEHEAWQGQIYSRSGKSKKYPPFTRTGYGTGAGLGGWNCRHSFAPYVDGSPRAYDDAKLQSFKDKTRTYNGHELTEYEATQYQRALERDLRRYKRQQLAGVNGAQEKLDAANARLDDYCKQTGLKRQYSRDDVVGWNGEYRPTGSFKPVKISEKVTSEATSRTIDVATIRKELKEIRAETSLLEGQLETAKRRMRWYPDRAEEIAKEADEVQERLDDLYARKIEKGKTLIEGLNTSFRFSTDDEELISYILDLDFGAAYNYREVKKLSSPRDFAGIVSEVAGADLTSGSCASVGLAYIGQQCGLDVLDFRGGESMAWFSSKVNKVKMFKSLGVKSLAEDTAKTNLANGRKILQKLEVGKEYYLSVGRHASIVRKNQAGVLQYLELQAEHSGYYTSGWHDFEDVGSTLKSRFGCSSSSRYVSAAYATEISQLRDNDGFRTILGYINTAGNAQRKGAGGGIK